MVMERLQILVTSQQRELLERRARDRGVAVAALVREAIDAHVLKRTLEERMAAVARLEAMPRVKVPPPEDLRELIDSQHDDWDPRKR